MKNKYINIISSNTNNRLRNDKIDLYIDCDGVILNTMGTARRLAREQGINPDSFDGLHSFFVKVDWYYLISVAGELDDAISKIKKIIDTGLYNVKILTKLGRNETGTEKGAKESHFSEKLPGVEVITLDLYEHKEEVVDPHNSILIEDSLHNYRRWNNADGVGVLLLKGDYIYDYPDEKRITEIEREGIVDNIANFYKTPNVQQLLEARKQLLRMQKREKNTAKKYTKMLTKTRHF